MKSRFYPFIFLLLLAFSGTVAASNTIKSIAASDILSNTGDSTQQTVSVYPNLAHDVVNLNVRDGFASGRKLNVTVYNVLGNKVMNLDFVSNTPTILHVANLNSGLYFVTVKDNDKVIAVQKIVKE